MNASPSDGGRRPSFSVVTVCYNAAATLGDAIASVAAQTGVTVEHIVIDGGSTDDTRAVLSRHRASLAHVVSEPDHGIYDAMNKGIALARNDVVAILNADDAYAESDVLAAVADAFLHARSERAVDLVMAHIQFVRTLVGREVVRDYRSSRFSPWKMRFGWMPPHPACFIARAAYERVGPYAIDYRIASDYELLVRLLVVHGVPFAKLDRVAVLMRTGGRSTAGWRANVTLNREIVRACRANGVYTNLPLVLSKTPMKLLERRSGRIRPT